MSIKTLHTKADAGRKGGLTTLQRYGRDQLREWGKLGGRPRLPTYDDIFRQRERLDQNNKKGGDGFPGHNLAQLKTLYGLRQRSTGIDEIWKAGAVRKTPIEQPLPERTGV
jgi:hypothetical protein